MKYGIFIFIFSFIAALSTAQNTIEITSPDAVLSVTPLVADLPTTAGYACIEALLPLSTPFECLKKSSFSLAGFSEKSHWCKIIVHNHLQQPLVLEVYPPLCDSVIVYAQMPDNSVKKVETGLLLPSFEQIIKSNNHTLSLPNAFNISQIYYVKMTSSFPIGISFRIGTKEAFLADYHNDNFITGIFFGTILMIFLLNFSMFFAQKDFVYLWYALYLLTMGLLIAFFDGYLYEFFFKRTPQYLTYFFPIIHLTGFFAGIFALKFLQIKTYLPKFYKAMQVILGIFLLSFILTAFGEQKISLMMTYILVMPCTCFGLYASFVMIKKGHTSAWFYILGAGALSLSVGFYLFYYAGYGIQNMPIRFNIYIGVSLEAFFLSLAIVYRVKDMRLANLNNQVLAIKSLEENQYMIIEQNALLEKKVSERTIALQNALEREKRRENQVQQYAVKLEKSNRELTEFAHIVSHDLKAPLRSIASFTQLIVKRNTEKFDITDREYMNFVLTGARQSSQLVEDLLNYSKIDKNIGETKAVSLEDVVKVAEFNLNSLIYEKKAFIRVGYLPTVKGHLSLLSQLFQNIIGNGIKYNQNTNPLIEIGCEKQEDKMVFYVKDNGIGIAEQYQQAVFQMFRRLHSSQNYEGTGIGLAFCKRIVDTYGGDIWINSVENQGTTFYFTLPNATIVEKEKEKTLELIYE